MRTLSKYVSLLFGLLLPACASVTVTKITPNTDTSNVKGQRFNLPRPYIQVIPQGDGSIVADIVYLPDPDHAYAVRSSSRFSSDSLEVVIDAGLLKSLNWSGDSSAVVSQAITSAGNVASGVIQADQEKEADHQAKEDDASKAVDDADLAFRQAQSDLALLIASNAAEADILKARITLNDATLKLQAAQASLDRVRGAAKIAAQPEGDEWKSAAQPEGGKAKGKTAKGERIYGPMLFAIREELRQADSGIVPFLQVVAVEQKVQPVEEGWNAQQPMYPITRPPAPDSVDVRIFPEGLKTISPDKDGHMQLLLQASSPLVKLVTSELLFHSVDKTPRPLPPIALESPTIISVDLRNYGPGDYILHLAWQIQADAKPQETDLALRIVK